MRFFGYWHSAASRQYHPNIQECENEFYFCFREQQIRNLIYVIKFGRVREIDYLCADGKEHIICNDGDFSINQ